MFLLWYVLFYSFLGFLLEVAFARATHHPKKDRKCFLLLPLCPVYGVGALLIRTLAAFHGGVLWVMVTGVLGAVTAELAFGLFYRHVLRVDFWDYRDQPGNLDGLICLPFALYWLALSLLLIYGIDPLIVPLLQAIPARFGPPAAILVGTDGVVSAFALRMTGTTDCLRWYK